MSSLALNTAMTSRVQSRWSHHVDSESDVEDMALSPMVLEGCSAPYKDFLNTPVQQIKLQLTTPKSKRKGPRGGVTEPFPLKLYEMLCGVEREGLTNMVSWRSHGRSFHIELPKLFVTEIMPRYFKQSKLTSFQRQLNLYGFEKVSSGRDRGTYYHPLFLRGRPDVCKIMLRTRVKGGLGALIYASDSEESQAKLDFYSLPFCPPAVDSSQEIFREYKTRPASDNGHCEVSAEVSHSEEDSSESEYNLFADPEACFQPFPYNTQNRAPSPIASLWESTGDFSIPDRVPEHQDYFYVRSNESPCAPEQTMSSSIQEPRQPQYTIMDSSPFEPLVASSSSSSNSWFEPPPMNGSRPVVDFAGRTFQCMDDDHIQAYECALKKRYVA